MFVKAYTVLVMTQANNDSKLKECLYEHKLVYFKVSIYIGIEF